MWKHLLGWLLAVLTAAVAGSLVQSWLSTAAIAGIHEPMAISDRLGVVGHDLVHFAPTWGAVMALGLLLAFPVAAWIARYLPRARTLLFPLSGLVAVLAALLVMDAMLPVTLVAAARDPGGQLLLGLGGALAGWVYLGVAGQRQNGQN